MTIKAEFVHNLKALGRFMILFIIAMFLGEPLRKYGDLAWALGGIVGLFLAAKLVIWLRSD